MTAAAANAPPAPSGGCENGRDNGACEWLLEGAPKPDVDTALLETILADPALAGAQERGGAGLLEHLGRRLREWLLSLLDSSGAAGFAEWTRTLVLAAAVLLLVWLTLRWVRRRRGAEARIPDPDALTSEAVEVLELPARHLGRGRAALAGAPREAIRQGLLALLSGLEDAEVIARGRVRTNRELAQALPTSGLSAEEVDRLAELLAWYDRAFYSLAAVSPSDAAGFLDRIEARLSALASPEAAA